MTRITIIGLNYAPERSGNAPYTTSLAKNLSAAGHAVSVITGFPHYPEWQRWQGYDGWQITEAVDGVKIKRLRHYIPRKPMGLRRVLMEVLFGLRVVAARWDTPDVIILVSPALISTGLAAIRARLARKKVPILIWVQDLYSRGAVETSMATGPAARLAVRLESGILGCADGVVAIHERFRTYITDALDVPDRKVRVVRNWTHLPPPPATGQQELRDTLGWKSSEIIVLHAGNMGKKQGLENVIAAARLAAAGGSAVRFILMGDGNQRKALETAAEGIGNISFVDSLPDADFQTALTAADVLLVNELPGVREMSVPSKLTSYFNAGVPVLAATDANSVTAEEIASAAAGVRVDADDPAALVAAAEALGSDKILAKELGENGLKFRQVTLSEAAAMAAYDEFIHSFTPAGRLKPAHLLLSNLWGTK
ncbi:colanic acid biosynthesis glycosyl transferase WcaI [Arthrobacter sp. B3I9]|uniref:glycosyltransferase family 4 protein n=1 Tax=Arthrobacter sp. B3I9 TaxID=3042270 RepID=UPI00279497AA|nr:glycosyltransferase family 4 protein [Arthrobacter sp. B3I9]MDQ0849084.1 colanic acid biosynthesis glycosyl transferase WcaI [Arthrobacter sp. B3I9]